jgi:hypothetical protein
MKWRNCFCTPKAIADITDLFYIIFCDILFSFLWFNSSSIFLFSLQEE